MCRCQCTALERDLLLNFIKVLLEDISNAVVVTRQYHIKNKLYGTGKFKPKTHWSCSQYGQLKRYPSESLCETQDAITDHFGQITRLILLLKLVFVLDG